jgi:hypothetical protein
MITKERLIASAEPRYGRSAEELRFAQRVPIEEGRPGPRPEPAETGLLWRLILVLIGFGMALTGWLLILSIFLSFIGLPLFIFGLALMQSQER